MKLKSFLITLYHLMNSFEAYEIFQVDHRKKGYFDKIKAAPSFSDDFPSTKNK